MIVLFRKLNCLVYGDPYRQIGIEHLVASKAHNSVGYLGKTSELPADSAFGYESVYFVDILKRARKSLRDIRVVKLHFSYLSLGSFDGALLHYVEEKYDGRFRLHGFYPYSILGEVRPEKLYCACLWKHEKVTGPVNPEEDFAALKAEGVHPWVGAGIKKIEDMVLAAKYGAELITSNEPAFMMAELEKAGLRVKE